MSKVEVTGNMEGEIDCKRFYMSGVAITASCPECKADVVQDFEDNYLSYPLVGITFDHTLHCDDCDHEWSVELRLDITLKVV